jgi:nucleoside-diphosphate-sugar epimerase
MVGVDAVAHVASDVSFGYDPNVIVTTAVETALAVLKAVFATPSVKRFVQCSSSSAVVGDIPDGEEGITTTYETWNEGDVKKAWAEPHEPTKGGAVYAASKTQQEQAIWKYTKEHQSERPDLVVNSGKQHCKGQ